MLPREENFYSAESEAVIVDLLKGADRKREVISWWNTLIYTIQPRFGLYFAEIELLSRRHGLHMHLFAVRVESVFEERPDFISVDPNDMSEPCSYVAMLYPNGLDDLLRDAKKWGMLYEPAVNIANLEEAGICMSKPGSVTSHSITAESN